MTWSSAHSMASSSSAKRLNLCGSAIRARISVQTAGDAGIAEQGEVLAEQLRARCGQIRHPPKIQNEQRCVRRFAGQPPRHIVDRREVQCANQFDHSDIVVPLVQYLLLVGLAATARRDAEYVVVGDDAGADIGAAVEHMQVEARRQRLADLQATHTVAMAVEAWRKSAEPQLRRKRGDN